MRDGAFRPRLGHDEGESGAVHSGETWDQGNDRHTARGPAKAHALPLYTGDADESLAWGNMYHKQIAELTTRIVEAEGPEKIILFGSYASGTATESSDIDLLVISRSTLSRPEREVRLTRQLFGSGVPTICWC